MIVAGLPRSGTSMMMRMLEAGGVAALTDEIRAADEDNPRGYYEFEPVKKTKEDASWLERAPGKVVKMVHVLLYQLPPGYQYKVVFMRRALPEVVASQNVMLERQGKPQSDLPDELIMEAFQKQLDKLFAWVGEQPNFDLLQINYNEILRDPAPSVRAIDEFLGGGLDTAAMMKVVEPGLYRQRK
jgi:hypothetical protein